MGQRFYTLHFGHSRSRRYAQAVALAGLCPEHQVTGTGRNVWHRITVSDDQIDLMASLHELVRGFVYPRIHGGSFIPDCPSHCPRCRLCEADVGRQQEEQERNHANGERPP